MYILLMCPFNRGSLLGDLGDPIVGSEGDNGLARSLQRDVHDLFLIALHIMVHNGL